MNAVRLLTKISRGDIMRFPKIFHLCLISIIVSFSFFFIGCDENDNIYSFGMYYLEDNTLSYSEAVNTSINKLKLKKNPFISANDIQTFTVIYIEDNPIISYRISLKDSIYDKLADDVSPFVLVINENRFSLAEYWPAFMSFIPQSILMYRAFGSEFDLLPGDEEGKAKLRDPTIINALENLGVEIKYKEIGKN
jgi:hypothetical protein